MAVNVCPADTVQAYSFPPGWRGWLLGRLDRQFHDGVADSLQRLKRAAEERATSRGVR